MSVSFCLPHPVAVSDFSFVVDCVLLLRCCECMCFGSKVRPITFGCVVMGSAMLFILGPDCSYSGVNRVQVVLSGFNVRLFCLSRQTLYVGMVVCISLLHSCFCV